jgi:hypothetical protein
LLDVALSQKLRHCLRDDFAILEYVSHSCWNLGVFLDDVESTIGSTYEIDRVEREPIILQRERSLDGAKEPRVVEHELPRQIALEQSALWTVEIRENPSEQLCSLGNPSRKGLPFLRTK